ncbi:MULTISPECIES: hypothetical protein [unclassified Pseudomonas]|uniref:hypothetical protein n=2 Tax=Pseudomonas TaxID=286 RepID=UPI0023B9410A|nr:MULTISPECIES: hypothetical protein [unclassified Pseudomonas]
MNFWRSALSKKCTGIFSKENNMQKTFAYAVMLAATLGLAACDKPSEDAAEDAREARSEAQESMNEAAEHEREAVEERTEENREEALEQMPPPDSEPTNPVPPPAAPAGQTNQ